MADTLSQVHAEGEKSSSEIEELEKLSLRKMSFLLQNQDDTILSKIENNECVKDIDVTHNGRVNLRIDYFDDMAVQNILKEIISSGGVIKSISTEEPSLEDVFIKSTAGVVEDDRA